MSKPGYFGFGVVFGPSTSSVAGFPAKISAQQGKVLVLRAAARVYGERCSGLSASADPLGCSLRTYLRCVCEGLTGLSLRWRESATPAGHWWLVLGRSEPRTKGTGCGSWPTVQASGAQGGKGIRLQATETGMMPDGTKVTISLRDSILRHWPTPRKADSDRGADYGATENHDGGGNLRAAVNWPTPRNEDSEQTGAHLGAPDTLTSAARQWPTPHGMGILDYGPSGNELGFSVGQAAQANPSTPGKPRGSLNAEWVAQLMGFPPEFTAGLTKACCEYWETHGSTHSQG